MRIEAGEPRAVPTPACTTVRAGSFHSHIEPHRLRAPEARTLLSGAWTKVMGNLPAARTSALLTAHWALETDGGRCMPGHNFAGIKAAPSATGKSFPTIEGHGATRRKINARFRVYESAEAGANDYVRLLATHYPEAIAAARVGDSAGFARALAHGGYFTAAPEAYAAGLEQRLANLEQGISHDPRTVPRPPGALAHAAFEGVLHAFRGPEDG